MNLILTLGWIVDEWLSNPRIHDILQNGTGAQCLMDAAALQHLLVVVKAEDQLQLS
jgi:hypothetical protein